MILILFLPESTRAQSVDAVFANIFSRDRVCLGDGSGGYSCSDASTNVNKSFGVALGDMDGDGHLDAVFATGSVERDRICLGDGSGGFSCSDIAAGVPFAETSANDVALGYVNGDGNLDAVFATSSGGRICLGDGSGGFSCSYFFDVFTNMSNDVALGDVNGDGKLDAVLARSATKTNKVCLGDGSGGFGFICANVDPSIDNAAAVELLDVSGDGKLDAVFANLGSRNRVCLGNGSGGFSCSDINTDTNNSLDIALGDVNGDGKPDAVFANINQPSRVCLGDGAGSFSCSDTATNHTNGFAMGDVSGDGNLDTVFANHGERNRVCLGDGAGSFLCSDVSTDGFLSFAVALGELNTVAVDLDYGDAPDPLAATAGKYPTLLANDGARHTVGSLYLGPSVDSDSDGQQSAQADGDDTDVDGDDEDGITFLSSIIRTTASATQASLMVDASANGELDAWIDFNQDGDWGDLGEQIFDDEALTAGNNVLAFTVPAGASAGGTFSRFRISSAGVALPTGLAPDGEVEDYSLTIADGDTPAPVGIVTPEDSGDPLTISLNVGGTLLVFTDQNGVIVAQLPVASVSSISITGTDGDDQIVIDFSNGNPIPSGGIFVDGGDDAGGGDSMELSGASPGTVTHTFDNAHDGSVALGGLGTIDYEDLEPIIDNLGATDRVFTFTGGAETILLKDDPGAIAGKSYIDSSLGESVTFANPTSSITVNAGTGDDTFTLTALDPAITATSIIFNGGVGDDMATLTPSTIYAITVNGDAHSVSPYDTIDLDPSTLTGVTITHAETSSSAGTYSFDSGYKTITYTTFEKIVKRIELVLPIDTESGISIEPSFTWDFDSGFLAAISSHTVEIDTRSDFLSGSAFSVSGIAAALKTYSVDFDTDSFALANNTNYYWRTKAPLAVGISNVFYPSPFEFRSIQELTPALTYPVDGLKIYSSTFYFSWNLSRWAHSATYLIEVDDSPWDGTPSYSATTTNRMYASSGFGLRNGSSYAWRITVRSADGRTIAISDVESFSIEGGAVIPTPSFPIDDLQVYSSNVNLSWYPAAPFSDLTFDIEYDTVPSTGPFTVSSISGLQHEVTGLTPGTDYKWKIRSTHVPSATTSSYSGYETFSTRGPGTVVVPIPSYPVNDLVIYTTAPTLHWYLGTPETGLTFDLVIEEVAGPTIASPTGRTATEYQVTGLEPGKSYKWKVKSKNGSGGYSGFSSYATFSVAGGTSDGLPKAAWPIGTTPPTVYTTTPTLSWFVEGSSLGITSFTVEWDDDPAFGSSSSKTGLTVMSYTLASSEALDYGETYYWRVEAFYSGGTDSDETDSDSNGSFTVVGTLGSLVPVLTHPVGGLVIPSTSVTLSWYVPGSLAAVTHFKVEYADNAGFAGSTTTTVTAPAAQLSVTGLTAGKTYSWKVKSSNDGGSTYSSFSSTGTFVIPPGASPVTPRVGSPTGGIELTTVSPTISWFIPVQSTSVLTYDIEYGPSPDLSGAVLETGLTSPFYSGAQLTAGTYYWRARSVTEGSEASSFSEIAEFSTLALSTDVEDGQHTELPERYDIGQNYPNPFNPLTTIEYSVPKTSDVTIRVYNMLGQVVRTLLNGQVAPGTHRVQWDARDDSGALVTSGLYTYRIQAADYSRARTLVLLK